MHTTNYLNHPGHGTFQGEKNDGGTISTIIEGLKKLFDLREYYNVVLVGYCPSAEVMTAVYKELEPIYKTKDRNKGPVFVVDPVLGDNGRLYVPEEVVQVHIDFLKRGLVDLTTPNQFEMELLTDTKFLSWNDVKSACYKFYDTYKVPDFVILSVLIDEQMYSVGFSASTGTVFYVPIQEIHCRFSGCGDIFTALLTNEFYSNGRVLSPQVLTLVVDKLHRILVTSFREERARLGRDPDVIHDINLVRLRDLFERSFGGDLEVKYL